ncbi:bluetail domain-containing putative surface protein [Microcystis aeruginosa FBCC-A68]
MTVEGAECGLLVNITGFTGTLPALGSINVSSFFI